jgi:hypothetical protein
MRDRIIIIVALLFIGACAILTFIKISSHYSTPYAPAQFPSPPPLVPSATATATTPARPVSTMARPRKTVTAWITVTAHPAASSAAGEDGR